MVSSVSWSKDSKSDSPNTKFMTFVIFLGIVTSGRVHLLSFGQICQALCFTEIHSNILFYLSYSSICMEHKSKYSGRDFWLEIIFEFFLLFAV